MTRAAGSTRSRSTSSTMPRPTASSTIQPGGSSARPSRTLPRSSPWSPTRRVLAACPKRDPTPLRTLMRLRSSSPMLVGLLDREPVLPLSQNADSVVFPVLPGPGAVCAEASGRSVPSGAPCGRMAGPPVCPAARRFPRSGAHVQAPRVGAPSRALLNIEKRRLELRERHLRRPRGGPPLLETEAVGARTQSDYAKRLREFDDFCDRAALPLVSIPDIEKALPEFFDWAYLAGRPLDAGAKLLAAVGSRWPHLHRSSRGSLLARAKHALQGWARVDPPRTRLPLPWPVLSGLAVLMIINGFWDFALLILLAADAYLRPGELAMLTPDNVVRPRPALGPMFQHAALLLFQSAEGIASKTHQFDDPVVLDSVGRMAHGRADAPVVAPCASAGAARRRRPGRLCGWRCLVWQGLSAWSRGTSRRMSSGTRGRATTTCRTSAPCRRASDEDIGPRTLRCAATRRAARSQQGSSRSPRRHWPAFLQLADFEVPELIAMQTRPSDELLRRAARATGGRLLHWPSRSSAVAAVFRLLCVGMVGGPKSGTFATARITI